MATENVATVISPVDRGGWRADRALTAQPIRAPVPDPESAAQFDSGSITE